MVFSFCGPITPHIFRCSGRYGREGVLGVALGGCVRRVHMQVVWLISDFGFSGAPDAWSAEFLSLWTPGVLISVTAYFCVCLMAEVLSLCLMSAL